MAKILKFKWLTDGDSSLDKKVSITDEEYESLKICRGFPDEIDMQGGAGYPPAPAWLGDCGDGPDPFDREPVKGKPHVTVLVY